ncbi:MAG TPA: glucokinase [Stellaceae bacterium]|nr:glucokinase [Stellaceae bacterium]
MCGAQGQKGNGGRAMSRSSVRTPWLVGDIGGTNARFGLVEPDGRLLHSSVLADADYAGLGEAIEAYLAGRGGLPRPREAAIAVASPITGDAVRMTNHPWAFSISELRSRLGFVRLEVINDFTAQALALPHLGPGDKTAVGGGAAQPDAPIGVLGPGSGLGVSGLILVGRRWVPLSGEGGHATMASVTERESAVLSAMRRHFDHVSAERVLSGPGLVNLYNALAEVDGAPATQYTAAQITDIEVAKEEPRCREATEMFCAMLGTVAGDLALTLGAKGGVYIGGGIVPRLGERFAASRFRERFEAKGRFRGYLAPIPTFVVTHKLPAFLGCAAKLRED